MYFTKEENNKRAFYNLLYPVGKKCKNCFFGSQDIEDNDEFITCRHHLENFSANSFCGYWIDPKDPILKERIRIKKDKLRENE